MSTNAVKPEQAGAGSHQVLTFVLGNETYGVDILRVQEIRGWSDGAVVFEASGDFLGEVIADLYVR